MTPIYRSPDHDQTRAIQSLLLDHNIQASIIESKKSDQQFNSRTVIWYELWLRNYADATRAKAIITQREFTSFKTSMSAFKTTVAKPTNNVTTEETVPATIDEIPLEQLDDETDVLLQEPPIAVSTPAPAVAATKAQRENLIPINNKRVFKRLGLLLGYSEEEIEKLDSNKLYRPWDAGTLMERVKNLKQKCS
ncbi:hypothetical protein [Kaarinaea lacus]